MPIIIVKPEPPTDTTKSLSTTDFTVYLTPEGVPVAVVPPTE